MAFAIGPFAALTVAGIFYCHRTLVQLLRARDRRLRERVAYMLWMAADVGRVS